MRLLAPAAELSRSTTEACCGTAVAAVSSSAPTLEVVNTRIGSRPTEQQVLGAYAHRPLNLACMMLTGPAHLAAGRFPSRASLSSFLAAPAVCIRAARRVASSRAFFFLTCGARCNLRSFDP